MKVEGRRTILDDEYREIARRIRLCKEHPELLTPVDDAFWEDSKRRLIERSKKCNRKIILLSPTSFEGAVHLPVIRPKFFDIELDLSSFNAVIFTSKHAVVALDLITSEWKKLKVFSVGSGTSEAIRSNGGEVFYEATDFYGDTLANEIVAKYPNFSYFYPRAKEVVSNLEAILIRSSVEIRSEILYETVCNKIDLDLIRSDAIIIFTAPSTVKCFFEQTAWKESWRAVAIGKRTQEALDLFTSSHLAPKPTIKSAVELSLSLDSV